MKKRKLWDKLLILCFAIILLWIGYYRERYIFNFILSDYPFMIPRGVPNLKSYPFNAADLWWGLVHDPRWFSTLFQTTAVMGSTAGIVYYFFKDKRFAVLTIALYMLMVGICGGLILLSMLTQQYDLGYSLAQHIKDLFQLPFFIVFLLPAFRLFELQEQKG